jgi:mRNA interferase MazF
MAATSCRRGEIWLVNFHPGRGSEQKGPHPALILQNDVGNIHAATTIVAAITTTTKKYPVTVLLGPSEAGLRQASMVNLAELLTIDKGRLLRRLGGLGHDRMQEVEEAIRISLGLDAP